MIHAAAAIGKATDSVLQKKEEDSGSALCQSEGSEPIEGLLTKCRFTSQGSFFPTNPCLIYDSAKQVNVLEPLISVGLGEGGVYNSGLGGLR
jgi:hypothetical protein